MDQYISADSEHQHSVSDWGYHGRLRWLYLSNYSSKHKPVNHHDTHQSFYLPKSSKIYRCWIVWNRNICVVIIPLIFAVTFFGQLTYLFGMANFKISIAFSYVDSSCHISRSMGIFQAELLHCSSSGVAGKSSVDMSRPILDRECYSDRLNSVQDHEGVLGSWAHLVWNFFRSHWWWKKLWSIIFIPIESGTVLFAIQLGQLVLEVKSFLVNSSATASIIVPFITIQQMLNVIIGPVILLLIWLIACSWPVNNTYNHPGMRCNGIVFPRWGVNDGSYQQSALCIQPA